MSDSARDKAVIKAHLGKPIFTREMTITYFAERVKGPRVGDVLLESLVGVEITAVASSTRRHDWDQADVQVQQQGDCGIAVRPCGVWSLG
jgi:hypothetical protein